MSATVTGLAIAEPRVFDGDDRVGSDAAGDPGRRADDRVVADHGFAAQDRGIGVDDDAVFDGRVAFGVADDLAGLLIAREAESTRA